MTFKAYRRPDGRAGIRNYVLVIPASTCAEVACKQIASGIEGVVALPNPAGCGQVEGDVKLTIKTLAGCAANPNVYGTLIVGLGCEVAQCDLITAEIDTLTNKPHFSLVIQEEGGVSNTVSKGRAIVSRMVQEASELKLIDADISELVLGTNCGGSDPTSGLAANPTIGVVSDKLVRLGGTSLLTETTEFVGAEHILARRAVTPEVGQQVLQIVKDYESHLKMNGQDLTTGNPSPGNKRGGLTTLEEKSLGCIHKGGHSPIVEVIPYASYATKKGLVIMDTPGFDAASVTGMIAGGCQVVIFSTGLGTPTGNPLAPELKITGNPNTAKSMEEHIDFDASPIVLGKAHAEELGEKLFDLMLEVCNGKKTRAEILGFQEFSVLRICKFS